MPEVPDKVAEWLEIPSGLLDGSTLRNLPLVEGMTCTPESMFDKSLAVGSLLVAILFTSTTRLDLAQWQLIGELLHPGFRHLRASQVEVRQHLHLGQ